MAVVISSVTTACADDVKLNPAEIQGIATFKSDGVNLRKGPSSTDPYLCAVTFGEMDYSMADLVWSNQAGRTSKIHKQQGYTGMSLPVIGRQVDWVKMYYGNSENSFEVWTMSKFVDITPLSQEITTKSVTNPDWGTNAFTCLPGESQRCAYYTGGGLDEDQGIFVGKVVDGGKVAVFDIFSPIGLQYDESQTDMKIAKDDYGAIVLIYGPKYLNERGNEYSGFNIRALTGMMLTKISKYGRSVSSFAVIGPDGYIQFY